MAAIHDGMERGLHVGAQDGVAAAAVPVNVTFAPVRASRAENGARARKVRAPQGVQTRLPHLKKNQTLSKVFKQCAA
jgi:hypothetical protein